MQVNNNNATSGSVNGTHDSVVSNVNSVTGVKTRVLLQTVRVMVCYCLTLVQTELIYLRL